MLQRDRRLEDAAQRLTNFFKLTVAGKGTGTMEGKKVASIGVVCTLFSLYSAMNNVRMCRNLVGPIEKHVPLVDDFPRAQAIAYHFYVGRLALFEEDHEAASQHLQWSLEHCRSADNARQRLVMRYLVPAQLLLGTLPVNGALQRFGLQSLYGPLIDSVKTGDIGRFDRILDDQMVCFAPELNLPRSHCSLFSSFFSKNEFVELGVYHVLARLRNLVILRLCRLVSSFHDSTSRIDIDAFRVAMAMSARRSGATSTMSSAAPDDALDEVECLLANLISQDFVRGYIAHDKRKAVFSTAMRFPPMRSNQNYRIPQ